MSYEKPRINLTDNMMSVLTKMAGGNPGAINVLMQIMKEGQQIDPRGALGGLGLVLLLDTFDIYEERIFMLYKDVCKQDIVNMIACLRACQLGMVSEQDLNHSIDRTGKPLVPDELLKKVQEQLPEFGQRAETD